MVYFKTDKGSYFLNFIEKLVFTFLNVDFFYESIHFMISISGSMSISASLCISRSELYLGAQYTIRI